MGRGTRYPFIENILRAHVKPGAKVLEIGAGGAVYKDAFDEYFGTDLPGFQLPDDRYESRKFINLLRNLPEEGKKVGIKFTEEEQHFIAYKNAERILKLPEGLPEK